VICDAPAGLDEVSRTLLLLADLALLPICPSILDLRSVTLATSILRYAQSINGDRPQGALVLNKMRRRDRISRELVHAIPDLGIGIAGSTIRDLQAFRDAAQQGSVVTRMNGRATAAADDLNSLATELFADWLDAERAFRAEATR
jgi:chromosome partitioning protein